MLNLTKKTYSYSMLFLTKTIFYIKVNMYYDLDVS